MSGECWQKLWAGTKLLEAQLGLSRNQKELDAGHSTFEI